MHVQLTLSRLPVILVLILALVAIGGIGFFSYQADLDRQLADTQLTEARQLTAAANELLSAIKDAETGQRGYLITGGPAYLQPYEAALRNLPALRERLHTVLAGQPSANLAAIDTAIDKKLQELADTVELRRSTGFEAARQVVLNDTGKDLMDEIRAGAAALSEAADQRAAVLAAIAAGAAARSRVVTVAGGFILLTVVVVAAIVVLRSLAERERLYAAAASAAEHFSVTLSSIGDAVVATDPQMRITFFNPVAQKLTGWTQAQALNTPLAEVFKIVNESTRAAVENPLEKALATGVAVALANHTVLLRRDGGEVPIDDTAAPIRNRSGAISGAVLVFRDITERRRADRQMRQSNEQLQDFVSAAAHDLRSPLGSANVLSTMLLDRFGAQLGAEGSAILRLVSDSVTRMIKLVDSLLAYAQASHFETSVNEGYPLDHALNSALANLRGEIEEAGAVVDSTPLPYVTALEVHTIQLFQNLVGNAIKYRGSAPPEVKVWCQQTGSQLTIHVGDNGIGIAPEFIEQIFKPFRRLHGQELPGSGIGLATCQRIVRGYGGRIWVDSTPGKGSVFHFTLPAADKAAAAES